MLFVVNMVLTLWIVMQRQKSVTLSLRLELPHGTKEKLL